MKNQTVHCAAGTKATLAGLGHTVSYIAGKGETKQKSLKLHAVTLATGNMVTAVHQVKDNHVKIEKLTDLGPITQNCNHNLILVPARPSIKSQKAMGVGSGSSLRMIQTLMMMRMIQKMRKDYEFGYPERGSTLTS